MFTELMRLEANWTEICAEKKTGSCKKCNQPLDTLALNGLRVVLFDVEVFGGL